MDGGDDALVLLLPERRRFGAVALSAGTARALGRADRLADATAGEQAQLARYFTLPADTAWPMAAITRQADVGDAEAARWLRADPVYLRADMGGARMLAWGNLDLDDDERAAAREALAPLFAEAGVTLSAPTAERWYLRLPAQMPVPEFSPPERCLGDDVFGHLPAGAEGRRWRAWLNECQVLLHNAPFNVARSAAGRVPANSLWFWGGGELPEAVRSSISSVRSEQPDLRGLSALAGVREGDGNQGRRLLDLRHLRDWRALEATWLESPGSAGWERRRQLLLDFADGARWRLQIGQRWRVWRRPLKSLGS